MKYFIFTVLLSLLGSVASAATYKLFEYETQSPSYYIKLGHLYVDRMRVMPGDELILDTGEIIYFKKYLGSGDNTIVILDESLNVVRLPQLIDGLAMNMFLGYLETHMFLKSHLSPKHLVQLLDYQTRSSYAVRAEWLPLEDNLFDYLNSNFDKSKPKFKALIDFLYDFKGIIFIGDFTPSQIGYVHERGWVIFDFGTHIRFNKFAPASSIIDQPNFKNEIPHDVYKTLDLELTLRDMRTVNIVPKAEGCMTFLN